MKYCWIIYYEGILCKKKARKTQEGFGVYYIKMYENIALSAYWNVHCMI